MHPMLNTAIKAARRGASIINRASFDLSQLKVTEKKQNDYVTEIDQAAEQAIVEVLLKAYPNHAVLAEESGASANLHDEAEFVWIIDPLDGTTNFIHGFPQYCVSIALQQRGVTTQAVIYDPTRNDLFHASRGEGAYLNDKRIRVSKCTKLADSLIGTGFPARDLSQLDQYMAMFKAITEKCQGLRRPGSAALDLAYVAAGRLDGFFEKGLSAWDMAAGALLISEAGGIIGDFKGEQTYMEKGDVIAGNPKIFYQMISLLGTYA
ncbi:MAG: suhB [Burkholderiaceae bacterium]|nr:suhB [Burkholderiaceae bacterium]